jgi:hypothetical protein
VGENFRKCLTKSIEDCDRMDARIFSDLCADEFLLSERQLAVDGESRRIGGRFMIVVTIRLDGGEAHLPAILGIRVLRGIEGANGDNIERATALLTRSVALSIGIIGYRREAPACAAKEISIMVVLPLDEAISIEFRHFISSIVSLLERLIRER